MLKIQSFYTILGRLSKREKLVFYCAVFFISLTILDRLIISPISDRIKSLDNEIEEKESAIRKNLRILAHKDKILADKAKYRSFIEDLKSEEEEMTSILKEIEVLADKSSIYLIDLKPGGVNESGSSKRYIVNLNCEAQMEQLVNFMYNIENSNKLLMIEQYQAAPKSKESSVAKCRLTISKMVIP